MKADRRKRGLDQFLLKLTKSLFALATAYNLLRIGGPIDVLDRTANARVLRLENVLLLSRVPYPNFATRICRSKKMKQREACYYARIQIARVLPAEVSEDLKP